MNIRAGCFTNTILFLCIFGGATIAAPLTYEEYAIKTAFLYRSLHYVEWNDKNTEQNIIVICFTKSDNFSNTFQSLQNRKVNERTISFLKVTSYDNSNGCDVMYVPTDRSADLRKILNTLNNKNILTISDRHGNANNGVILNFPVDNQKVSIEINIDAANKQNIKFSAKLLRIAEIIGD